MHVPGSAAPTRRIESLWMSITRWVLRSGGPFASFLHSYIGNKSIAQVDTAHSLWPLPAPYPQWLKSGGGRDRSGLQLGGRQRAVNLAVLALSWLHLGCPAKCPAGLWCGMQLSGKQKQVVSHLESHFQDVQIGEVGPAEMGRSAARVESLIDFCMICMVKWRSFCPTPTWGLDGSLEEKGR